MESSLTITSNNKSPLILFFEERKKYPEITNIILGYLPLPALISFSMASKTMQKIDVQSLILKSPEFLQVCDGLQEELKKDQQVLTDLKACCATINALALKHGLYATPVLYDDEAWVEYMRWNPENIPPAIKDGTLLAARSGRTGTEGALFYCKIGRLMNHTDPKTAKKYFDFALVILRKQKKNYSHNYSIKEKKNSSHNYSFLENLFEHELHKAIYSLVKAYAALNPKASYSISQMITDPLHKISALCFLAKFIARKDPELALKYLEEAYEVISSWPWPCYYFRKFWGKSKQQRDISKIINVLKLLPFNSQLEKLISRIKQDSGKFIDNGIPMFCEFYDLYSRHGKTELAKPYLLELKKVSFQQDEPCDNSIYAIKMIKVMKKREPEEALRAFNVAFKEIFKIESNHCKINLSCKLYNQIRFTFSEQAELLHEHTLKWINRITDSSEKLTCWSFLLKKSILDWLPAPSEVKSCAKTNMPAPSEVKSRKKTKKCIIQ